MQNVIVNAGLMKMVNRTNVLFIERGLAKLTTNFMGILPGDMIRFVIPNGVGRDGIEYKTIKGRAVICLEDHVVVNIGGQHGTPKVVTESNYVDHKKAKVV